MVWKAKYDIITTLYHTITLTTKCKQTHIPHLLWILPPHLLVVCDVMTLKWKHLFRSLFTFVLTVEHNVLQRYSYNFCNQFADLKKCYYMLTNVLNFQIIVQLLRMQFLIIVHVLNKCRLRENDTKVTTYSCSWRFSIWLDQKIL